jgi:hypothetical protein
MHCNFDTSIVVENLGDGADDGFFRMTPLWPACRFWVTQLVCQLHQMVSIKTMYSNFSSKIMSTSFALKANLSSAGKYFKSIV